MQILKIFILLVACMLPIKLSAAGPMMHIVLGERWLASYAPQYTEEEKKLFLLGTVFPDIRYLGVIKREKTHYHQMTLLKVKEAKSPFQRGMLFHSFVDEFRAKFVRQSGIEKKLIDVPAPLKGTFLKLIEDQIVNNTYNWSEFRGFLSEIPPDEKKFGIDDRALMQWHTGLTVYFTAAPTLILAQISLLEKSILHIDAPTIKSWSMLLPQYANDQSMQNYVTSLITAFDKAMVSH